MRLRSPRELGYRLWQEAANLRLASLPPQLPRNIAPPRPFPGLPSPETVRALLADTSFPDELRTLAASIRQHRIPLLGLTLDVGPEIHWRRDYVSGRETEAVYFKKVPYLDASIAGDHKNIWELNRHQHLVVLAQAALFDKDPGHLQELWAQLESWIEQNPIQKGINWASALEVAFRALAWLWIYHLAGDQMPETLRFRFLNLLYHHGLHLEANLSIYFSPNTHLMGEGLALEALGTWMPSFPSAGRWRELGRRTLDAELAKQVQADGSYWEQSTYYHVYATDMFLVHGLLQSSPSAELRSTVGKMAEFLAAMMGPDRSLPFFGDDDGGRFFHPFGPRHHFGKATLAACSAWLGESRWTVRQEDSYPFAAWWLGDIAPCTDAPVKSQRFGASGLTVLTSDEDHVVFDAGSFGPFSGGHSHADALHLVVRSGSEDVLIDPGTFTYVGDPQWRDWFRGTAAHNTVSIDGQDQAVSRGPFRWEGRPDVRLLDFKQTAEFDQAEAECSYSGFTHRRCITLWRAHRLLLVLDQVRSQDTAEHHVRQSWHLASAQQRSRLVVEEPASEEAGWVSPALAVKTPAPVVVVSRKGTLPMELGAAIFLNGAAPPANIQRDGGQLTLQFQYAGKEMTSLRF